MDFTVDNYSRPAILQSVARHAVEAAEPVLPWLHLRPSRYKAMVGEWERAYRVSFVDKDSHQDGTLGNPGKIPGIQVQIDRTSFAILRFGLIR